MAAATLSPAALATELGTDARTARKFLRSITPKEDQPGKGARWAVKGTKTEIARLQKAFRAFSEAQEKAKNDRAEAKNAPKNEVIENTDEVIENDENEFENDFDSLEGPTEAELNEAFGV